MRTRLRTHAKNVSTSHPLRPNSSPKGIMTSIEVERFAQDIVEGLQGRNSDRLPPRLLLDYRAVVAARHLILAGEVFIREARNPSTSRGADRLS